MFNSFLGYGSIRTFTIHVGLPAWAVSIMPIGSRIDCHELRSLRLSIQERSRKSMSNKVLIITVMVERVTKRSTRNTALKKRKDPRDAAWQASPELLMILSQDGILT